MLEYGDDEPYEVWKTLEFLEFRKGRKNTVKAIAK